MNIEQQMAANGFKVLASKHPELEPVFRLHRGMVDSYIGFYTKNEEAHEREWGSAVHRNGDERYQLRAVRADFIPLFMPLGLDRDAFYSINGLHGSNPDWRKPASGPFASSYRKKNGVKYLNSLYADIDCHEQGQRVSIVAGAVLAMMLDGLIPEWTVLALSGRGVWLFWWLRDDTKSRKPVPASIESIVKYERIQVAIQERIATDLPGYIDNLKDITRITRVPGSLHTGVNRRVRYVVPADENAMPFLYTLDEAMAFFGVQPERNPTIKRALRQDQPRQEKRPRVKSAQTVGVALPPECTPRETDPPWLTAARARLEQLLTETRRHAKDEVKARGGKAIKNYQLARFELLRAMRGGGFREGCRHWGCCIYARALRGIGMEREEIIDRVLAFARQCDPPFSEREARDAIGQKFDLNQFMWKKNWVVAKLRITPSEGRRQEEADIPGKPWSANLPAVKPTKIKARREVISQILDELKPYVPSTRDMAVRLKDKHGIDVTNMTIHRDYEELRITARKRKRSAYSLQRLTAA